MNLTFKLAGLLSNIYRGGGWYQRIPHQISRVFDTIEIFVCSDISATKNRVKCKNTMECKMLFNLKENAKHTQKIQKPIQILSYIINFEQIISYDTIQLTLGDVFLIGLQYL